MAQRSTVQTSRLGAGMLGKTALVLALSFSASAAFAGLSSTDLEDRTSSSSQAPVASGSGAADTAATLTASQPSRFSRFMNDVMFAYFNFSSAPMNRTNEGSARLEAYNYLSLGYRFNRQQTLSIRPVFTFSTGGETNYGEYKSGDFKLGDAYLNYKYKWGEIIPGTDARVNTNMRVYAPTSTDSSDRGMIARLRPLIEIEKRLTRDWTLNVELEPDYYIQSRTAFRDRNKVKGNRNYGYEASTGLEYRINRILSAAGGVGHSQMWHHTSPVNGENQAFRLESLSTEAALNFSLGQIFMVAGISHSRDLARPKTDYQFFNPEESEYYLLTNINF